MSILVSAATRVLVQGITGHEGSFHTRQMLDYGTQVVAGVTPGKGGSWVEGVPVFDTVQEAMRKSDANTSIIYVPARFAADAIYEAADAGITLIVCITEGIPTLDMVRVHHYLRHKPTRLIGPNSPGLVSPGLAKVGIMPGYIHRPGSVGVVSRSGTLTYEVVWALTSKGIGQSTCIGLGGDPIVGSSFTDILTLFEQDPETKAVVLIGEIGGAGEERAAAYIRENIGKPVVALIAGQSAPPEKRMGHAGAIISGGQGTARDKIEALRLAGARIADSPEQIPDLLEL
jgi:succinyl-CoA synthetase alpha subunit